MIDWEHLQCIENCPPRESMHHNGDIFVFVKHSPPVSGDFKTAHEKGLYPNNDPCKRQAISCGISEKYLDSIKDLFPVRRRWRKAKGKVSLNDGVIKQTGHNLTHHSFWINPEVRNDFHSSFTVI